MRGFSPIMNAGENLMAWFYEIRDLNNSVASTGDGFDTYKTAMAAGRKKARQLKASRLLPDGVATIKALQHSEVLHREGE
jgi:hypothetical protein